MHALEQYPQDLLYSDATSAVYRGLTAPEIPTKLHQQATRLDIRVMDFCNTRSL